METAATDEQLVDRLVSRLDDLIHTCKQQIGASVEADTVESHGENQETTEGISKKELLHEKWHTIFDSRRHYERQKVRPDVPAPRCNVKGSSRLAFWDSEPQLTTTDYETLSAAHSRSLELNYDQLARSAGFEWHFHSLLSRTTVLPRLAEEALEAFWIRYGKPGKADIFVLCELLGISRDEAVAFFMEKLRIHDPMLKAKEMLEHKFMLQEVKNQGRLEGLVKELRENDQDMQVLVEGMD